jgi:hypothetical protein
MVLHYELPICDPPHATRIDAGVCSNALNVNGYGPSSTDAAIPTV